MIPRLWHRYQQFGLGNRLPPGEERYVRALNGMVLIVTGLLWMQLPLIVWLLPQTRWIPGVVPPTGAAASSTSIAGT